MKMAGRGFRSLLVGGLLACGMFLSQGVFGQTVQGTVFNDSAWQNDESILPPHWHVAPTDATTNGQGQVIVALFIEFGDFVGQVPVDTLNLEPPTDDDLVDLVTIQGTNWDYSLGTGLDAGNYRVMAWIDGNGNGERDKGEPFGYKSVIISGDSDSTGNRVRITDDSDADGMEDWWEIHWFGDLNQTAGMDYDNDGLSNIEEYDLIHTAGIFVEPNNWDTDADGLDDAWENFYGLDPTDATGDNGRIGDPDGDGIINYDEYIGPDGVGWRRDRDGNNIAEYTPSRDAMNPMAADTDHDGVIDGDEFLRDLTHPVHAMSSTNYYPRSLEMAVNGGAGVQVTDPTGETYAFRDGGGTVEFWIRPGSDGDGIIYGFDGVTGLTPHFRISLEDYRPKLELLNGTNIMAVVGGAGANGSVQKIQADKWTHVACVIAPLNNSLDLYVDGVLLIAQKTYLKPDFTRGSPVICKDFSDGYIDELRIWDYPRSAADIEYWSKRIYPAPGYVQQWGLRASGSIAQMYKYSNPQPLLGYFRFDDGGDRIENFAFINYGLYPNKTEYYIQDAGAVAAVTKDQAISLFGSDDADGDELPEWWTQLHNIEKYQDYYSTAYGPVMVSCPDDTSKLQGFKYFREFTAYGSIGTSLSWKDIGGSTFYDPKTRPDFYDGDKSSYMRYVYLFAQPSECPLNIYTPGMKSTIIYVNGTRVTTAGDEANQAQSYDIAQYMHVGRNMIHVRCESELFTVDYLDDTIDGLPYTISDYQAYNPGLPATPVACDDNPYKFQVAVGKFDADLACNGVPMIVRGDQSRADPRSVWHCQVWSKLYEGMTAVPHPDQEGRGLPENPDYGVPLNAERDNNPIDPDSADDDLDAVYEYICGTNPRDRDSDNNGISDGYEDFDHDGLLNKEEQRFGSDPWLQDSDDDGIIDGVDVGGLSHPAQALSPQFNRGIRFGGTTNDYLTFPLAQRFGLDKWTVEVWVKPDADENDGGIIMQRAVATNAVNYEVGLDAANLPYVRYVSTGGTEVRVAGTLPVAADGTTWTHIAASYYDRELTLYVNGTNVAYTTGTAFPAISAGGPVVQQIATGFKGCMDELRLWNDDRTAAEIVEHRDEVLTGVDDALVAYYRFDDGTSYTNLPPQVGTSANNGTNGLVATPVWDWGQVEDNVRRYDSDWRYHWDNAASFHGAVGFSDDHKIVGPPRLQVYLKPTDAVDAGAQWTHNGGASWNDSEYTETHLSAGGYTISFKGIDGWIAPASTNVTLVRGELTVVTGAYVKTSSLTVIINNSDDDVINNATWTIDGGVSTNGSGATVGGLMPGAPGYDILFSDISATTPGWNKPSVIHVELLEGESRTVSAEYIPVSGRLQISFEPDTVPPEARWRVSGNTNWFGSGEVVTNLSYGDHDVEYSTVQWWKAPSDETIKIEADDPISLTRLWTKLPEPLTITGLLSPAAAIGEGAKWLLDGAEHASGDSVLVNSGQYQVSFKAIDGWLTPMEMAVDVSTNGSVTVTGLYYRADSFGEVGDGGLETPAGIAVDGRFVYVADSGSSRIRVYDTYSKLWASYGIRQGSVPGLFSQPFGVDIDDAGNLWVADTGNHRIQRLSGATGRWDTWGQRGSGQGQFNAPYDVEVDAAGSVFVADYHNSRVQRMTAGVWSTFVSSGSDAGHVRYPSGLAVAADKSMYVSDYNPAGASGDVTRVQHFTQFGQADEIVGGSLDGTLVHPRGLAVRSGSLLAVDQTRGELRLRDAAGIWSSLIYSGTLLRPEDVDADSWGNMYVADTGNGRILKFYADDADGDGIPDAQETKFGTNPNAVDSDGDGYDDLREVYAGTDPTSNASVPYFAPLDYAGDLVDDIVSYANGRWNVLISDVAHHWSDGSKWGANDADWPVPGDFDGDGVSDFAVFRTGTGRWYVDGTSAGRVELKWGVSGDIPISADFDGDKIADFGIFRPSTGWWVIRRSSDKQKLKVKWGVAGDVPVPGDYDGDGKTDFAVFRPSTGWWYLKQSSGVIVKRKWGIAGDVPVPGFYDTDAKTDLGIYRNGRWIVLQSATQTRLDKKWGIAGDAPVPADYDGDAKTDLAVFRRSTGMWIMSLNSGRLDVPVPRAGALPVHQQYRINRRFHLVP
jgi:hypothetical protein